MSEQHFEGFDHEPEESRSARKREAQAIRKLVEDISNLGDQAFKSLIIPDDVKEALLVARKLKPRSDERRRQLQYVARLQRGYPESDLDMQVKMLGASSKEDPNTMKLERLRQELIDGGKLAIDAMCSLIIDTDRNKLRTLVKKASEEAKLDLEGNLPKPASRALYKYIKSEFARVKISIPNHLI